MNETLFDQRKMFHIQNVPNFLKIITINSYLVRRIDFWSKGGIKIW